MSTPFMKSSTAKYPIRLLASSSVFSFLTQERWDAI